MGVTRRKILILVTVLNVFEETSLQWRHNGHHGISNHQPHDCLLNRLFKPQIKKTSKLGVTGLCEGNSPVTGWFSAQRPVTRKMFLFDDVIMMKWYFRFPSVVILSDRRKAGSNQSCSINAMTTADVSAPVTQSFDGFFDLYLNKRLSKQSRCRWLETPSRSLWRHCNDIDSCDFPFFSTKLSPSPAG